MNQEKRNHNICGVRLDYGSEVLQEYRLEAELERWEGTFEAGGKIEYVKYDKANPRAPQELREAPDELSSLLYDVKKALDDKGLLPEAFKTMDPNGRTDAYREVARSLGFRAMKRQEDVYGLIEFLVGRMS